MDWDRARFGLGAGIETGNSGAALGWASRQAARSAPIKSEEEESDSKALKARGMTWLTLRADWPRVGTDSAALRANAGHRHLIGIAAHV